MSNFPIFERIVFEIISQVMEQFPDNINLDLNATSTKVEGNGLKCNFTMVRNTFEWLKTNGYLVQKSGELGPIAKLVSPTDKLFILMGTVPDALKAKKQTIWEFFRENAKAGTGSVIQQGVSMLLTQGAKLIPLPWS